jgi:hypothetical protein
MLGTKYIIHLQLLYGVTGKADTKILRYYFPDSLSVTKYIRLEQINLLYSRYKDASSVGFMAV